MNTTRRDFLKLMGLCLASSQLPFDPMAVLAAPTVGTREAQYYEKLTGGKTRCLLCPNHCERSVGERGKCRARENDQGTYRSRVYGQPCVIAIDPVEKCPLYHFRLPAPAFSIATAGCNLACQYCQNWQFSQKTPEETRNYSLSPEEVIQKAKEYKAAAISFFYTEPTIYIEYMKEIATLAAGEKLPCIMVTGGYINQQPLDDLMPLIDAFVVGLKGFDNSFYQRYVEGTMEPVQESLRRIRAAKRHLEIVTLLVPTLNDQPETLAREIAWIGDTLGTDVPLHFTRFNPQFKLKGLPPTPVSTLEKARQEGLKQGLHYVYTGNIPGHEGNHTYCPKCQKLLVERLGFKVLKEHHQQGMCPGCSHALAGSWK